MKITTEKRLAMHNPPHPGGVFRRLYMEPLELTVTEVAKRLGVSRKQLSLLVNERAGFSPDMALRVGIATNTTPESWAGMQAAYDLWQAKRRTKGVKVQKLAA
jgi:addiction module HigA family antidote